MSLSRLPNELIAQIGSFLDYKDNQKFALAKKRFHAVLARDRLDKPEIDALSFEFSRKDDEEYVETYAYLQGEWIELDKLKDQKKHGSYTPKILNIINKFCSIDTLELKGIFFHDHAGFELIRTKMRHLVVKDCGFWVTRDTFVNFCKRFKTISFQSMFTDASFVNDAFFTELIRNGSTVNFHFGLRMVTDEKLEVDVTDSSLDALTATKIPEELRLGTLITKFSFPRVLKMCENALKSDINEVCYDFGFFTKDQYPAVMKFVNEDFEDWTARMKLPLLIASFDMPFWKGENDAYTQFAIRYRNDKGGRMNFSFAVDRPAELLEQENEMDTDDESGDENSDEDQNEQQDEDEGMNSDDDNNIPREA